MIIYILHSDKYFTFRLPKKKSGSYVLHDFDSHGFKRNLVSVTVNEQQSGWVIHSSDSIRILYNNNDVDKIELKEFEFYTLKTNAENIVLYVSPGFDRTFVSKQIPDNTTLTIGSSAENDIVFPNSGVADKQVEIVYIDGEYTFKNLNCSVPIYVNGIVYTECKIRNFDDIFIYGLKIVFCGNLIFCNNPLNVVLINSNKIITPQLMYIVPEKVDLNVYKDFYDESQYFRKSPVFRTKIHHLDVRISPPSSKGTKSDSSFVMDLIPSGLMSITSLLSTYYTVADYSSGKSDKRSFVTSVVMCLVMLFTSLVWPFIQNFAMKIRSFIEEKKRASTYRKYLKKKRQFLENARNEVKASLKCNNLSLDECQYSIMKKSANLFSVSIDQSSFLDIVLGNGKMLFDCKFLYEKPDFIEMKDKLLDEIDKLISDYKYIDDVPCCFNLKNSVAFINENDDYSDFLQAIILQLITYYDYVNLKIVIMTSEKSILSSIRNLNHCWDNDREFRYFATTSQEGDNLSSTLIRIWNERTNEESKEKFDSHYLIITDRIDMYRNTAIIDKVLSNNNKYGFSIMFFCNQISDVPSNCPFFVNYNRNEATLFKSQMDDESIVKFKPYFIDNNIDFDKCLRIVCNTPIKINGDSNGSLPEKIGFLELYNVGNVKQLNSVNRWKESQITNTLAAPIGVDSNGNVLSLDLHEKTHGPHGLIAGTSGSGKSEFIITYILSLAVNYSPNEVQFVLIDYKGGGLAGAFENRKTGVKLPHLVGTITNLDKSSMSRTLVSIKSELQRRQKIFNDAKEKLNTGTIDIYKYQKLVREGSLTEYLAHLFIICDEFAELKQQQPDFMDELVSTARIGRSLGVHLILATQKPSGVVDDQIWSNSKFKICCKVQTADDSIEMLRKPDAAYIKESGRFYLQVGYDEIYVKGQSAYTGTLYVPSETVKTVNSGKVNVNFIDDLGNVLCSMKKVADNVENKNDFGEELTNVLDYLIQCASEINFKYQQLWLDNVPTHLMYSDLVNKYKVDVQPFNINPIIGEYDNPTNQSQGYVSVDLTNGGNVAIMSSYGGGKTTLMETMIYSSIVNHTTSELNIYIVDFISGRLKAFSGAPQVGDYISSIDADRVEKLMYFINFEIEKRKKYYSSIGGSFSIDVRNKKSIFPNILVFLNGFEIFTEQFDEVYDEQFQSIIRDCNRFGITFIISTTSSSLSYFIDTNFPQKIALRFADSSLYSDVFDTRMVPSSNPGRGLIKVGHEIFEFQTALLFNDDVYDMYIKMVLKKLNSLMKKARSLPVMPRIVTLKTITSNDYTLDSVPIGIGNKSNCEVNFDFSSLISFVLYINQKMASSFMTAIIELLSNIKNTKVIVLDGFNSIMPINNVKVINSNFKVMCLALYNNINKKKSVNEMDDKVVFIINDYQNLQKYLLNAKKDDDSIKTIDDLIELSIGSVNMKFILVNNNNIKNIDDKKWSDYVDSGKGILLGMEAEEQELIEFEDRVANVKITKDIGVVINKFKLQILKFVRE